LGGATALLPVYARDILVTDLGGSDVAVVTAVGALAMALYLGAQSDDASRGSTEFGAVALFGLLTMCSACRGSFALSLAALALMGAADMVSVVVRSSLVQLQTPDAMRAV